MASSGKEDEEKTKPEGQKDGRTGDKMIDDAVDKMLPIFLEDGVIDHTDPINDTYFKEIVDVAGPMLVPGLGQPDPEVSTVFGCYDDNLCIHLLSETVPVHSFMNLSMHSPSIYSSIDLSIHSLIHPIRSHPSHPIHPLTYPFIHSFIHPPIHTPTHPYTHPPIHPSIQPPTHPSILLPFTHVCINICLSIHPFIHS